MKFSHILKNRRALTLLVLMLGAGSLLLSAGTRAKASCMDIADIPLDTMTQSAPGMIMFVIDDSGSMDWSVMVDPSSESDGLFDHFEYIFHNPGDDLYGSREHIEDYATHRMMWMSQWVGYNGLYYDPETEYTPWPRHPDADVDNPLSDPVGRSGVLGYNSSKSVYTLDMTQKWHVWGADLGVVVDNSDATGFTASAGWASNSGGQDNNYLYSNGSETTVTATWTAPLDSSIAYNVEARWVTYASRSTDVHYLTYDGATLLDDTGVNQQLTGNTWTTIATNVTFSSGIGTVTISESGVSSNVCADAVRFVPQENNISDVYRRHYFTQSESGDTYLVNLNHATSEIEYYQVNLSDSTDNREVVTAGKLLRVTSPPADIVTGRSYTGECQNFANWYSFYRRRELTAKNAIAKVIETTDGVFTGLIYINNYRSRDIRALPVKVTLESGVEDERETLLDNLYGYNYASYGTPLRNGLKKAGRFYQGDYLDPGSYITETGSSYYPYFKPDKGGSCQQAFTIVFTDGYYNGSAPYTIDNDDGDGDTDYDGSPFGDGYSDTLADVAMYYYENDLNSNLDDDLSDSDEDPATHQHMVTYSLAFGVTGSLNPDDYPDCPLGACPSWPSTSSDSGKIDDMYHAAVNGRGEYLSAGSTSELNEALLALSNSIKYRLGSSAAVSSGSIQRTAGSVIYQGKYNSNDWSGELLAWNLELASGAVGSAKWSATIPEWDTRKIITSDGTDGFDFVAGNLGSTQTTLIEASGLGTAEEIVNFLRGDTSNAALRTRGALLGDILHSSPTYFGGTVFIGANDGMLHAFDAETGEELFAYVPNLVYDHLAELADPDYSHRYYVDNTPTVKYVDGKHILVGALGKGGKGYFALDVTDPDNMDAAADFLWEFPAGTDADMGYSFSQANIVNTKAGYVVIFGNGYDSDNGHAVLYILDALTGDEIRRFDTQAGDCNGLSMPAVVDDELDGYADYIFAGDLKGNMWKIDIRDDSSDNWEIYYGNGSTPQPLITVRNESDDIQPITTAPEVMSDCASHQEGRGLMLLFGTGQYLNKADFDDHTVQSVYGVWDWGAVWEGAKDLATAKTKYLGVFQADRSLTNTTATLLEQEFTNETDLWWTMTNNQPSWYDPAADEGLHVGWYFDLPESDEGERIIQDPVLRIGRVVFLSTIPSNSPCASGGRSSMYILHPCTGGPTGVAEFDVNEDEEVDETDTVVEISGSPFPQVKKMQTVLYGPTFVGSDGYLDGPEGDPPPKEPGRYIPEGMYYWRVLGD
jgi:hypothetical protein